MAILGIKEFIIQHKALALMFCAEGDRGGEAPGRSAGGRPHACAPAAVL